MFMCPNTYMVFAHMVFVTLSCMNYDNLNQDFFLKYFYSAFHA